MSIIHSEKGSLYTARVHSAWQAWHFGTLREAPGEGEMVTVPVWGSGPFSAWQAWYFGYLREVPAEAESV